MKEKAYQTIIFSFIVLIVIFDAAEYAHSESLRFVGRNEDGVMYYDRDSIKIEKTNTITLWVTQVYSQELSDIVRRSLPTIEQYRRPYSKASFIEINCKERYFRTIKYIIFDEGDNVLYLNNNKDNIMNINIVPGSIIDKVRLIVCR